MEARIKINFLFLAIFQTFHSLEEYYFKLWEHLAPARFLSGLVSEDLPYGFAIINCTIVILVSVCYSFLTPNAGSIATSIVWFWAILELLNGAGHLWFGWSSGGYFPGLYTAPFLLVIGVVLLRLLSVHRTAF